MKKIIVFFLILISNLVHSQDVVADSILSSEIRILQAKKCTHYFFLKKYSIGSNNLTATENPNCNYSFDLYLFWEDSQGIFFQKLNKCNSQPIKITTDLFVNFATKLKSIKNEKIKPYQVNPEEFSTINHSEYAELLFQFNNKISSVKLDYYTISSDKESPNINYTYNTSLQTVKWLLECDSLILNSH